MKSKRRKQITAIVLCMVLMFSTGMTSIAESEPAVQNQMTGQEIRTEGNEEKEGEDAAQTLQETDEQNIQQQSQEQETSESETAAQTQTTSESPKETQKETQEEEIRLEGQSNGYTVVLTAPASSFPEDSGLSMEVSPVDQKTESIVEKAVEARAKEEERKVESYTAFDIRIFSNGTEVQPSGPVHVTFSQEGQDKTAESDETRVYHVDEETGAAEDMQASVNEAGQAKIETTHFSVYVVVDLDQLGGQIELTVQHWATVTQLTGVDGMDGLETDEPNNIVGDGTATLSSEEVFTEIYSPDTLILDNKLEKPVEELSKLCQAEGNNYTLKQVWVLQAGKESSSKDQNDWNIYNADSNETITFQTNNPVIRLVYEPDSKKESLKQAVTFYDYNVLNDDKTSNEGNNGINSDENYTNQGNYGNRIAVGMATAGVKHAYGENKIGSYYINQGNGEGGINATPNMVTGVNENGPVYNGLQDPGLFSSEPKKGKEIVQGYQLAFKQVGDTYTLSSVLDQKGTEVLTDLETFQEIYDEKPAWSNHLKNIYSNNFWPLDRLDYTGKDPLFGARLNQFEGMSLSDDKKAHNWFFGMRYDFEFTLGDYTGPLNYYFRGDDDFWLFIDGKLATDLGGIHSSIGANLDLKEFLEKEEGEIDKNQTHRLTIIYAERGGAGSTCYMQFTLPNVKPVEFDTTVDKTTVTVEKKWEDHNNPNRPTSIQVELYYREDEKTDWQKYDTQTLSQANGWTYTWSGLPEEGYSYKVKEVGEENGKNGNYEVTYPGNDGVLDQNSDGSFSGTITNKNNPFTWITVNKVWKNDSSAQRPDRVEFYLYYREEGTDTWNPYPDARLTLNPKNAVEGDLNTWRGEYENLPVYGADGKKLEYTVMEVSGDTPLGQGGTLAGKGSVAYTVSYPDTHFQNNTNTWTSYKAEENAETLNLTVTNFLPKPWQLIKRSSSSGGNRLEGATFSLTSSNVTYTGVSGKDGVVTWKDSENKTVDTFPDGEYKLQETGAPTGYRLNQEVWTLKIEEGVPVMIVDTEENQGEIQNNKVTFYFENTPMYALPSSGGIGIYPFVGGGLALMTSAGILLKKRNKYGR